MPVAPLLRSPPLATTRPANGVRAIGLVAGMLLALGAAGDAAAAARADLEPEVRAALEAAAGQPGRTATGAYLAGLHAQRQHDYGEAVDFILQALAADPGEPALRMRAFQLLVSEGRIAEALPLAREIAAENPGTGLANLALAVDAVRRGDAAAARGFLQRMPDGGVNRLVLPLVRAWIEAAAGRFDPALTALDPLRPQPPLQVVVALQSALILDRAGRAAEAAERYRVAASAAAGNLRVTRLMVNFLVRQGNFDAADEALRRFATVSGEPDLLAAERRQVEARQATVAPLVPDAAAGLAEAMFDVATAANQPQSRDLALIVVRLTLALAPRHTLAHMLLADLLEDYEQPAAARKVYLEVAPDSPLQWSARLRAASALDKMERTDEAVAELRRLVDERTDRAEAALRLGDILRARSRFPEAVQAYDQGIARIPTIEQRHWSALYSRGIALERSKQWDRAEADFLKALELQPEQPYVLNYLAYSWVDRGLHLERSLAMLRKAVELRPEDGYIVDSLGWVMYRMGRFEEAVKELERAVELRPLDPVINDHLGDAYWRTGRRHEARVQWQRALTLKPEPDQVKPIEDKVSRGLEASDPRPNGG
ncbi:tetratricopeptide repeat protein [Stella sp.]|uniref:tetratricopeptide repeat protein n=1 Tax=Stella sp. TaxID=2912054 RepID=UPI0035AEBE31